MLFLWKAIFPQSSTNRHQEGSTLFKELTAGTALELIWRAPIVFMLNKRQWTVKLVWTLIHSGSHLSSYLIRALKNPSKIAKHWKNHLPWVKSTLKKLIRKRDKYFRIKNKIHKSRDIQHHKSLRREVRRRIRQSYWTYVISIFSYGDREEQPVLGKRFWSFIKNSRTDKMGMLTLKCGNNVLPDASLPCA